MSREPIIVDEVDVSGCVYRAEEKCILKDDKCCSFPNCDYKNWQRKEQECEFWKKELNKTHLLMLKRQDELVKEILKNDQLKAESDSLKSELMQIYCYLDADKETIDQLKTENETLEKDKANLDVIIETLKAQFNQLENENKDLENQLEREKERFEKQDKLSAMFIQELKNEKSSLVNEYLKKIGQLQLENIELKELVKTRIEDLCDSCGASSMMPMPCKVYEQALQEIKELVKKDYCSEIESCEFCAEIGNCINRKILQKCEALKDE